MAEATQIKMKEWKAGLVMITESSLNFQLP
jgi:hypothetical protein